MALRKITGKRRKTRLQKSSTTRFRNELNGLVKKLIEQNSKFQLLRRKARSIDDYESCSTMGACSTVASTIEFNQSARSIFASEFSSSRKIKEKIRAHTWLKAPAKELNVY